MATAVAAGAPVARAAPVVAPAATAPAPKPVVVAPPAMVALLPKPIPVEAPAKPAAAPPEMDEAPWPDDDGPPWEENSATALTPSRTVAIPVRDAGEPGRADQPQVRPHASPSALAPIAPSEEGDFWFDAVMQLVRAEAISALVRELGLQSQLVARDTDRWVLRVERESLNQGNSRERLATALQTIGHQVRLVVEIGTVADSPSRRLALEAERQQREAEAQIMGDPFVQTMMRDFGGKIVPGSIKPLAA
ncbi:MAG: DNA polymerase III subunit gamma/tau C-terminal domain-containing protein [Hydrogenophaga sp.]|nr:DNA polymerase III subunit gamma/tau C-terminal domain-containing protein [Hydrogenophaga sp.]